MRKHLTLRNLVGALALLGALLLRADGSADDATCCNLAGSYATNLFPGGEGDEGFFGLPVGVPGNAMIVLDNSGSMLDFPQPLPAGPAAGTGTCSGYADLDAAVANRSSTPYDNGTANPFIVDNPPWGLASCGTSNSCLFNPNGYYWNGDWGTDWAWQYPAGSGAGGICQGAPASCQTCLDTRGYYVYTDGWWNTYWLFKGDFLNGYPPKYVIARKVVKDLVAIDQSAPKDADSVRYGLTVFTDGTYDNRDTSLHSTDGGVLVVPLGPNCDLAQSGYLSTSSTQIAAYKQARQAVVDAVNNPGLVLFGSWTPLGETLFNVGQYFSDTRGRATWPTTGATGPVYDYMFGAGWARSSFYENAAGTFNAPWVTTGRQESVCWSCQQNSTIIVTDGEPTHDANVPRSSTTTNHTLSPTPGTPATTSTNDFRRWNLAALTVPGCSGTACSGYILQKVAHFLHNQDLRPDLSNSKQTQSLSTYTISFGLQNDTTSGANAIALLDWTAQLGGGRFYNTSSGEELQAALHMAVTDTIARANSFSVSNTNTLQTGNNNQLVLARFRKLLGTMWEGHLFRYKIFNEYVQGCDVTKNTAAQTLVTCTRADGSTRTLNPNLNGDEDCNAHAVCDGLYVLDADCDPVTEDEVGDFRKATLDGSTHQFTATSSAVAATPYWDAGAALSYKTYPADYPVVALRGQANTAFRSADPGATNPRKIYTTLIGNGTSTATNPRIEFTPANAAQLAPYLELNGLKKVGAGTVNFCAYLLERIGLCGSDGLLPACPVPDAVTKRVPAADEQRCAVQVINWYRGWDVLDEDNDGCAGPGNPSNATTCPGGTWNAATSTYSGGADGEERIRGTFTGPDIENGGTVALQTNDERTVPEFWKLGDIFHSSPVLVKPPVSEFICDLGLEPQCVSTIHSPSGLPGVIPTPADYDVNGNGTIEAGENAYTYWRKQSAQRQQVVLVGSNDGMLHAFDAGVRDSTKAADWLGSYVYTPGTGAELWAFIPPDLLPKLKLALDNHQYFVDGDTMVRDVWVDNTPRDGKREPAEFHTVAVMAERSGGNHYTALDITDTTDPKFLWTFPPNCSVEQDQVAQTWTSFAPRPPPIGPIRLYTADTTIDPKSRGFEERWIVMLNGGFDPVLTRGRGVWMLDVWSGEMLWKYTDDDLKANIGVKANMWSVPATVALTDIGDASQAVLDGDGYFDTANWGDLGGTLFVARMKTPGTRVGNGLVNNWWVGRAFEEQRQASNDQLFAGRSEFFHMSANAIHLRTGALHTYLGGGNRDQLLQSGAACGPNNVLGCFQAGCTGSVTTSSTYGSCGTTNQITSAGGRMVLSTMTNSCTDPHTCSALSSSVQLSLTCAGSSGTTTANLICDASGTCSARNPAAPANLFPTKLTAPTQRNRFYGLWSYGGLRSFSTSATALSYDGGRLTDITYAATCPGPTGNACTLVDTTYATVAPSGVATCGAGSPCTATQYDGGWMYEYGRTCPMGAGNCVDPLPWSDERTASGQTLIGTCVDWNTFRPRGTNAASATDPCASADTTKARNYTYLADYIKGVPQPGCGFSVIPVACSTSTELARASQRTTIAPPPDPTQLVGIGMDGEVKNMGAQIEPGGTPSATSIGQKRELSQPVYWLEVDPSLHTCRHVDPASCQ
jgi:type IV pilus assembly protein PilY1